MFLNSALFACYAGLTVNTEEATFPGDSKTPAPIATDPNDAAGSANDADTMDWEPASSNEPAQAVCPLGQQDANHIGGPSICCSGVYAVCDDFEADQTGGSPNVLYWQVERLNKGYGALLTDPNVPADLDANSLIEISESKAARGKKSLHIVAQNSAQLPNNGWHHAMLVNRTLFPAPNNTFWGRAFIYYVSDAQSALPGGHVTWANASGTVVSDKTFYTWWRVSTFGHFALNCEHGDQGASSSVQMPVNRWACLEWFYKGDASNEITLYLDGKVLAMTTKTSATADNTAGFAPTYEAFRIGYEVYGYQYNPTPSRFEMYYDEVALDYNRIGCMN